MKDMNAPMEVLPDMQVGNAPLCWALSGYDGNFTATVNGGTAALRQQALDTAFTDLGRFTTQFDDALDGTPLEDGRQPSKFTLSCPPADGMMEGRIHISYRPAPGNGQRSVLTGSTKREEMRAFIEQCLGIGPVQRGAAHR